MATMAFGLFWLIWILIATVTKGFDGMSLALFTEMTPPPNAGGGLANAIAGSGLLILWATSSVRRWASWPASTAEYGRKSAGGSDPLYQRYPAVRTVYRGGSVRLHHRGGEDGTLLRLGRHRGAGAAAGADRHSHHREHAETGTGYAARGRVRLSTPKWRMISAITLKASVSASSPACCWRLRASRETAPLLFTSLSNQFWSTDLMQPIANLPVTIFKPAMSPFAEWQQLARAGVLLITLCVLLLNIARVIFAKKKHL